MGLYSQFAHNFEGMPSFESFMACTTVFTFSFPVSMRGRKITGRRGGNDEFHLLRE